MTPPRRTLAAGLLGLCLGVTACSGGGQGGSSRPGSRSDVQAEQVVLPRVESHTAVERAIAALAAAELTLADDFGPLAKADNFHAYLTEVAAAAGRSTRLRSTGCSRAAVSTTAMSGQLIGALGSLRARISYVKGASARVDADRRAVEAAAAALRTALAADPGAWRAGSTDEVASTLQSVAAWQGSIARAITSAEGASAAYAARTVRGRAADVNAACAAASARQHAAEVAAAAGVGSPSARPGSAPSLDPTRPPSSPPATVPGLPSPEPITASPAPEPTTETPTPEPTTETPTPEPTTETPTPEPPTETPTPEPTTETPTPEPTTESPTPTPTTDVPAPDVTTTAPAPDAAH